MTIATKRFQKLRRSRCTWRGRTVSQRGRQDVDVIGHSPPGISKPYIPFGAVQEIVLWNTTDPGYLVVDAGARLAQGGLQPGTHPPDTGRPGRKQVSAGEIMLGTPLIIKRDNVDSLDF